MTLGTFTPPPHQGQEDTLKIRFLTRVSSSVYGSHKPGEVFDWTDDKEAKQLIAAGMAEAATRKTKTKKVETASVTDEVETATTS